MSLHSHASITLIAFLMDELQLEGIAFHFGALKGDIPLLAANMWKAFLCQCGGATPVLTVA
jgi:hypothetical protein